MALSIALFLPSIAERAIMHSKELYLKIEAVTKCFGDFTVLNTLSFEARRGEFICVLGPSGCGKTTLLRIIAGLEQQNSGRVIIENKDVSRLPVSKRNVGIVFQSYALFPNLTAKKNIAYGLKRQKHNRESIRNRVNELLEMVGLRDMGDKYPSQLSGGQQQRIALARAIAVSPDLLLLDEPLTALDTNVRVMLRHEIRRLQQQLGITTLMVTHDQEEALTMADRILVIHNGRLAQNGTPREIYDRPATTFVAGFIGGMNFFNNGVKIKNGLYTLGDHLLTTTEKNGTGHRSNGATVTIAIRPEDVRIDTISSTLNVIPARVTEMAYRGALYRVHLALLSGGQKERRLEMDITTEKIHQLNLKPDMGLVVHLPPNRLHVFDSAHHPTTQSGEVKI